MRTTTVRSTPAYSNRIGARVCHRAIASLVGVAACFFAPLRAQKIVEALHLDRKHPALQWFEYCRADGGLLTIGHASRHSSRFLVLTKYDGDFKKQWQSQIMEQNGMREVCQLSCIGNRVLVFFVEEFKDREFKTFYTEFDLTGKKIAEYKQILAVKQSDRKSATMRFVRSINNRRLLAFRPDKTPSGDKTLQWTLFSHDGKEPRAGVLRMPYKDDELQVREVRTGNSGQIYILAKQYRTSRPRDSDDVRFLLFRYAPDQENAKEAELTFEGRYVTDLTLKPDKDENLVLAGFYSNRSAAEIIGVLYAKFDPVEGRITVRNMQEFDRAFLEQYLSPRQIERGRELSDFYLDDVVLRSDGGVMILAEQYYVSSTSFRDISGFWYSRDLHHYDDVIIFSIGADGKIEWRTIVSKTQSGELPDQLSYIHVVGPEALYLFYKARLKGFGLNVYCTIVDYNGKIVSTKPFFENFGAADVFYRESSEQISNDEALLVWYHSRKKTFSILKVEF
ncbi:MAG: hypothetical protein RMM53_02555 [Bacteroidia bacterium]|nr:hypothetical protein [Bacteroidia bacterium]